MKKEEQVKILKSDLQQAVDGKLCMNVTQFANAFGVSRERAEQMLHPLKYLCNGREKLFLISEIANLIYHNLQSNVLGEVN